SRPYGPVDQVKLYALQWSFSEVANAQDGWMFGGQLNPTAYVGQIQLEAGLGQYWWLNADQIAQALNTNPSLINTNRLVTQLVGGKSVITGYQGAFNQTNATLGVTYPELIAGQPLQGIGDWAYNWLAASGGRWATQLGLKLGQTKTRGDWSAGGYWEHIGQEAAVSAFTYDDFGNGGTNLEGWIVQLQYQLLNPMTLTARGIFTNFINKPAGMTNPTQTRLQLDTEVKF